MEEQAIADYNARICQAEGFGEFDLKVDLENQAADETRHKEEVSPEFEALFAGSMKQPQEQRTCG